jgi:glucose-6-phosphate isomerase
MTSRDISIDYALAMAEGVGPDSGLTDADLDSLREPFATGVASLAARVSSGELGFLNLADDRAPLAAVQRVRASLDPDLRDVLVLGIGGSSLGARAVIEALSRPQQILAASARGPRLHFPDNSDPWLISHLLETLEPRTTAALIVSKSGGTVETAAQMHVVRAWLTRAVGADGLRTRWVAITDPKKGALRELAERERWLTLPIPANIGGRFSALTAAGLLPAMLTGIDCDGLLDGAASIAQRSLRPTLAENPAGLFAAVHYLHHQRKGRAIHVLMPYADRLRAFAAWYVQLWAESLGKRFDRRGQRVETGPTPLPAVGATDQHAQMQLFMEGPRDKLITFIGVRKVERDVAIPDNAGPDAYLNGKSLAQLLDAERRGTTEALASDGRPSVTIDVPQVEPYTVGSLLMLYEAATALAGELYGIDAFDQPGVELGKRLAFGLLGRSGYDQEASTIGERERKRSTRYRL